MLPSTGLTHFHGAWLHPRYYIWKGNPMIIVKSFGKNSCKLCSCERMEIIKHSFNPECCTINSRLEIHGACCHLPRFHRLQLKTFSSADERKKCEKVSVNSPRPTCHQHMNEEGEDLGGNEFDWIHSQPGIDSTEILLDHFNSSSSDGIHLVWAN